MHSLHCIALHCPSLPGLRVTFSSGGEQAVCSVSQHSLQLLLVVPCGPGGCLLLPHAWLQETSDGEVVVFHDLGLARAFPAIGPNVQAYQQLQQQGHTTTALVQVCSSTDAAPLATDMNTPTNAAACRALAACVGSSAVDFLFSCAKRQPLPVPVPRLARSAAACQSVRRPCVR